MSQEPRQTPASGPQEERDLLDQIKIAGVMIAVGVMLLFFLSNFQHVEIKFIGATWHPRMIWALIVSALLGAIGAALAFTIRGRRGRKPKEQKR